MILHKNPHTTYVDRGRNKIDGANKSWFFGPGYHQIGMIAKDSFKILGRTLSNIFSFLFSDKFFTPAAITSVVIAFLAILISIWIDSGLFGVIVAIVVLCVVTAIASVIMYAVIIGLGVVLAVVFAIVAVVGFAISIILVTIFSITLSCVVFAGMCFFYVFFTMLWLVDRIILAIKSIHSRCGNCKRISVVPLFLCSNCGTQQHRLTPGTYGVLRRRCICGEKIPATFANGRHKLETNCPYCASDLAASDARQIGIQLVGGVSCGKTTFLAAFWHLYIEKLRRSSLSYERHPKDRFDELEHWFNVGISSSTLEVNASMYSVVHKLSKQESYQLTIYDIAGEAFDSLNNNMQQQQFKYCESVLFVLDPTISPTVSFEALANFIREFRNLKGSKAKKLSDIPIAVLISKSDLFKKEIGLPKIKSAYNNNSAGFKNLENTRDEICRSFLNDHGFTTALNLIDSEFTNAQFYPISAMGHEAEEGQSYEPWGVIEPMLWLIRETDATFSKSVIEKHLKFNLIQEVSQ